MAQSPLERSPERKYVTEHRRKPSGTEHALDELVSLGLKIAYWWANVNIIWLSGKSWKQKGMYNAIPFYVWVCEYKDTHKEQDGKERN